MLLLALDGAFEYTFFACSKAGRDNRGLKQAGAPFTSLAGARMDTRGPRVVPCSAWQRGVRASLLWLLECERVVRGQGGGGTVVTTEFCVTSCTAVVTTVSKTCALPWLTTTGLLEAEYIPR